MPCITYFPFLACRLRDLIVKLNEEIISDDQVSLKNIHDDIIDDILYIQDIFSLKIEKINYILTNSLFYYMVLPLLCGSLVSMTKPLIAISVSLYVTLTLFHYIKNQHFLNLLYTVFFSEKLNEKLVKYMEVYPKNMKNYFFDWNAQKKSTYNSFTSYISSNFSEPFIKSLVYQINPSHSEINTIIKKHDKLIDEMDQNSSEYLKILIEDVLSKFSNSEFDIMTAYHKNISIATGVNVGLVMADYKQECVTRITERMFNKIKEGKIGKTFVINGCREILYIYLKSKDDTLILLMSLLIFCIHRKGISKELLSLTKLLKGSDMIESEFDTNTILNEIFALGGVNSCDSAKSGENNIVAAEVNKLINLDEFETDKDKIDIKISTLNSDKEIISYPNTENVNELKDKTDLSTENHNETDSNLNGQIKKKTSSPQNSNSNMDRINCYLDNTDESIINGNNKNTNNKIGIFDNNYFKDLLVKYLDGRQKTYDVELMDSLLNVIRIIYYLFKFTHLSNNNKL